MRRRRKNITIIHNEIDYDKLAEAIVRANAAQKETEDNSAKKVSFKEFWKMVGMIIINKKASNGQLAAGLLSVSMTALFNTLAVVAVLAMIGGIIAIVKTAFSFSWSADSFYANVITILLSCLLIVLLAVLALYFRGVANEIAAEKDRNYIVAVFSGLVSFVALIVAFVSLFGRCGNG